MRILRLGEDKQLPKLTSQYEMRSVSKLKSLIVGQCECSYTTLKSGFRESTRVCGGEKFRGRRLASWQGSGPSKELEVTRSTSPP